MLVPLPSPVSLLGRDSGPYVWRLLIGHTSRRRASHDKQTPHSGKRESDQHRQPRGRRQQREASNVAVGMPPPVAKIAAACGSSRQL
jgi:hypothetical protein